MEERNQNPRSLNATYCVPDLGLLYCSFSGRHGKIYS